MSLGKNHRTMVLSLLTDVCFMNLSRLVGCSTNLKSVFRDMNKTILADDLKLVDNNVIVVPGAEIPFGETNYKAIIAAVTNGTVPVNILKTTTDTNMTAAVATQSNVTTSLIEDKLIKTALFLNPFQSRNQHVPCHPPKTTLLTSEEHKFLKESVKLHVYAKSSFKITIKFNFEHWFASFFEKCSSDVQFTSQELSIIKHQWNTFTVIIRKGKKRSSKSIGSSASRKMVPLSLKETLDAISI